MNTLETLKTKEQKPNTPILITSPFQALEALEIYREYMREQNEPVKAEVELNYLSILSRNEKLFGVENKGKIVGTISTEYLGKGKTIIRKFFVLKAFRGQKVGSQLFGEACMQAVLNNHDTAETSVYLATMSDWKSAVKFYQQAGMTEIDRSEFPLENKKNDMFFMKYV
jgi:GNAT superfamily N-acetyltransferase